MNVSPNTGVRRETVTDFSRRQLAQHNLFLTLFRIDLSEMSKVREQGKVNVVRLNVAVLEPGRCLTGIVRCFDLRPDIEAEGRQGPSRVCTSAENPDAVVAELGSAKVETR